MSMIKNKKSRKFFALTLIVFILVSSLGGYFLMRPKQAYATWYDDNYAYRMPITIGNTGASVTNQKVSISIATNTLQGAGKMQTDCDDSRFTDLNGKVLTFYLATCNTSGSSTYSVLIPSILTGGITVYFYYGNPIARDGSDYKLLDYTTFSPTSGPTLGSEAKGPGPALYWGFDDAGYTTTAYDRTTNSNNGTVANAVYQNEDMCPMGKCLYFDGSADMVSKSYSADTELNPLLTGFTTSIWFRHPNVTISANQFMIARYSTNGYKVYMQTNGTVCAGVDDDASWGPDYSACTSTSYADNKWHQVEVLKTGATTSLTLYIDGVQITQTAPLTGEGTLDATPTYYVGMDSSGSTGGWVGYLDEARYYGYERSASQIQADYASRGGTEGASVAFGSPDPDLSLSSGLVGYWKMDESSWGTPNCSTGVVLDYSGMGYNGTACPATTGPVGGAVGKFGYSGSFDGSNDYVSLSDINELDSTTAFTIGFWAKISTFGAWNTLFSKTVDTSHRIQIQEGASSGELYAYIGSGSNSYGYVSGVYSVGQWFHIVMVYDGTGSTNADKLKLYINGVQKTLTYNETIPAQTDSNSEVVQLANGLNGSEDDVRIYTRTLSPDEITKLYSWAPGPVAYWNLNENTGSVVNDSSGNNFVGSKSNGQWASGKFGAGFKTKNADGTLDAVTRTNNAAFNFTNTQSFSFGMWVKAKNGEGEGSGTITLFYKGGNSAGDKGYTLDMYTSGDFTCDYADGSSANEVDPAVYYTDSKWHYVMCVMDRGTNPQTYTMYVDGIKNGSITPTNVNGSSSTDISIGENDLSYEGNASIDEVKIYNYARTPKQVIEDMNGGHPAPGSPVGSSAVWYKFDEGTGSTLNNAGSFGSSANATTSGSVWSDDGKFSNALQYNGTTNFSASPKLAILAGSGVTYNTVSWSVWVNPSTSIVSKTILAKNNEFRMTTDANSYPNCAIYSGSWQTAAVGTSALPLASWSQVVCTYDGSNIYVYVNGIQVGSVAQTGNLTSASTTGINIGWNGLGGQYVRGLIDEVKVYNLALNANEVKVEYNRAASAVLGSLSDTSGLTGGATASMSANAQYCVPGDTTACAGPIGEWKFDEGSGSANDTSGNGATGTLNNGPSWVKGKVGKALQFNGSSQSVTATIASAGNTNTIELWVFPTSSAASKNIINTGSNVLTTDASSKPVYGGCTGQPLSLNAWTHITAVSSGASICQIYQNGYLTSSSTTGVTLSTALNIGNSSFIGIIDNVVIYNYARADDQVVWDYHRGKPFDWWKMDECQGDTIYNSADSPGSTESATITLSTSGAQTTSLGYGNCVTSAQTPRYNGRVGKINSAVNFDGTNDYIQTPSNFMRTANNFSIAMWFKSGSTTYAHHMIFAGQWASDGWGDGPSCGSGSDWAMHLSMGQIMDTGSSTGVNDRLSFFLGRKDNCTDNLNVGVAFSDTTNWHHVVVVVSNLSTSPAASMYVDGKLQATDTGTTAETLRTWQTPILMSRAGTAARYFSGQMDDVRLYNYALTVDQVQTLYNGDSSFQVAPVTGTP
jgi:hypothetical protein